MKAWFVYVLHWNKLLYSKRDPSYAINEEKSKIEILQHTDNIEYQWKWNVWQNQYKTPDHELYEKKDDLNKAKQ